MKPTWKVVVKYRDSLGYSNPYFTFEEESKKNAFQSADELKTNRFADIETLTIIRESERTETYWYILTQNDTIFQGQGVYLEKK